MPTQSMSTQTTISVLVDEGARRAFELAWHQGRPEPIERFLPGKDSSLYLGTLLELTQIEIELGWKTRQSQVKAGTAEGFEGVPRAETYFAAYPKLAEPGSSSTWSAMSTTCGSVLGTSLRPTNTGRGSPT